MGIETTAVYDKATREFIINTPTPTAAKFWIGGGLIARMFVTELSCLWFQRVPISSSQTNILRFDLLLPCRCLSAREGPHPWLILHGVQFACLNK